MRRWCILVVLMAFLVSCQMPNRYLIHPKAVPPQVRTWTEKVDRGPLILTLIWAKPAGQGPFPTVLVHPDGGNRATTMQGIIWNLAQHGYLAVAADYRQQHRRNARRSLFPWRTDADVTAALDYLRQHPLVDATRIAALGFSQGGVYSLLIAAHAPDVKAVIAYYPVTDFPYWFAYPRPNPLRRFVFRIIRWYFRKASGARDEAEFQRILRKASALYHADRIRAPVLLIHGSEDRTAPVEESQRLATQLETRGREVRLVEIVDGRHVFNFYQPAQATYAWQATLRWLAEHVRPAQSQPASVGRVALP